MGMAKGGGAMPSPAASASMALPAGSPGKGSKAGGGTMPPPGMAMPLVGAPNTPPQFFQQSAQAGLIPGLGAYQFAGPQSMPPGWTPANIQGGPLPGQGGGGAPTPLPGAVAGPGGTYPMPKDPQFIDPNKVPVGGVTSTAPPGPPLTGTTAVPPAGFSASAPGNSVPTNQTVSGGVIAKTPLDSNNKAALAGGNPAQAGQAYANQYLQGMMNDPTLMHFLQSGRGGAFANALGIGQMPASFTPGQVSAAMQSNPAAAFQMLEAGGGNLQNAVQQQSSMTPQQMNSFINNTGYNTPGAFGGLLKTLGIG